MKSIFNLVFTSCLVSSTLADLSIDTTSALTAAQWRCLAGNGLGRMGARVYTSDGAFDEVGIGNIFQSSTLNLEGYNAHIVPCVANCKNNLTSGASQAYAVVNRLDKEFGKYPQIHDGLLIFIQIDKSNNWSTDQKQNQQFVNDMINALYEVLETQYAVIITNYNSWSSIVGANFSVAAAPGLKWVNWNGKADLTSGWTPFGGWASPTAHQYAGGVTSNNCTTGIPLNYSYFDGNDFSKLRKDRKMIRRANTLKKFNRH
uniref:Lysozyme n=1 Tax=Acrobeloides nanus TaxID=290746 RepID=A0A914EAV8_9BILA